MASKLSPSSTRKIEKNGSIDTSTAVTPKKGTFFVLKIDIATIVNYNNIVTQWLRPLLKPACLSGSVPAYCTPLAKEESDK